MKLLGKRIIVRELKEEKKASLIIVEEQTKPFFIGEVIASGTESGIDTGSKVLLNRHIGGIVEWEGETLQLFAPEDVIAIEE